MNIILLLCLITAALSALFALVRQYQMLQQNSYFPSRYAAWVKESYSLPLCAECIAFCASSLLFGQELYAVQLAFLAAVLAVRIVSAVRTQKKSVKKLVFTGRIKRLFAAAVILLAVFTAVYALFPETLAGEIFTVIVFMLSFISPLMTLLCRLLTAPAEKAIASWYVNDAKRILKEHKNLTVIGVTGSYGKTSVKFILQRLLSEKYNVVATPHSFNTPMGVVRTIREYLKPQTQIFICEMGAKNIGDIKEICDIVHPKYGIITSVGPQHLETFGSLDNVVKAKMELYDAVKQNGTVFLNIDSDPIYENLPTEGKIVTYGIKRDADYMAYDLSVSEMGISFYVKTPEGETERFTTKLLGAHNVLNILGAISVAHKLGMSLKSMTVPVACLEAVPHRLEIKGGGENVIIDDAYNSNPIGAKAALDALNLCDGMKIIITPGMVELGDREYELNKIFGTQIAEICDYVCLVGADHIYDGLVEAGFDESKIFRTKDVREAINHATSLKSTKNGKKYILLENDLPDNY